ncbi:hypothetical protein GW17_00055259, partial [Ensete ventricosum]
RLQLRCDFVAAGGIVAARVRLQEEEDGVAVCTAIAEEDNGDKEQKTTVGRVQFVTGHDQDSWQRNITVIAM